MALEDLSGVELVALALAVVAVAVALVVWAILDYKKARFEKVKGQRGQHPLLTAIVISFVFSAILWLPELFGFWSGRDQTWVPVVGTGLALAFFLYMFLGVWRGSKPKSLSHIHKRVILPFLQEEFQHTPYVGEGTFWSVVWQKRFPYFVEGLERITDTFIVELAHTVDGVKEFLVQYDPIDKSIIAVDRDPPQSLINTLRSQVAAEAGPDILRRYEQITEAGNVRVEKETGITE